ncbi:MAG: prephenate dehydrogenase/arogenate dehydrogenase family protein [Xanthomonadaceae bacterium]|nr:prephenate dehydrogenase/arogenate dehydrogenase family protein [Xanthomonadaceae bacterium]
MIRRLCIIGVGLIGGSLARALRRHADRPEIVGASRNAAHLQKALELGVIDRFETDLGKAVAGADLVMVCVPLGAMEKVFAQIRDHLAPDAVLTDVGSAKACVVEAARRVFGTVPPFLVPGHPIAGTEQSGVEASFAELYEGRRVILTPLAETAAAATSRVREVWEAAGATVSEMSIEHHDTVLAATSHLPHVLAFTLVDSLACLGDHDEIFAYAAGGFRDFTRIASSDPVMWRDICLANGEAIVAMLERFGADLEGMKTAIRDGDGETLLARFQAAKQARDAFSE